MMDDEGMIEFGEEQLQLQPETGMAAALVLLVDTLERHNALPKDEYTSVLSKILEHPDVPLDTPHTRFLAQVHELLTERPRPELTLVSSRDGRSHS
jgi:hypothetical protein